MEVYENEIEHMINFCFILSNISLLQELQQLLIKRVNDRNTHKGRQGSILNVTDNINQFADMINTNMNSITKYKCKALETKSDEERMQLRETNVAIFRFR